MDSAMIKSNSYNQNAQTDVLVSTKIKLARCSLCK